MRKRLFILTALFLMVFTSGCIKQKDEYVITIDKNNIVSISETVGVDKEDLAALNKEYGSFVGSFSEGSSSKSNDFESYVLNMTKKIHALNGFESKDYSDDEYVGFTQTKNNISIYDLKPEYLMPGLTSVSSTPITVSNGTYKIHLKYNYEKAYNEINERTEEVRQQEEGQNYVRPVKLKNTFIDNEDGTYTVKGTYNTKGGSGTSTNSDIPNPDITLIIKIPTKATKHNATKVINDNEYEWDLFVLNSDVDINLEYKTPNTDLIAAIVISILLLAIFGFLYVKNKGNK